MTVKLGWVLLLALMLRIGAAVAVQAYLERVAQREFLIPGDAQGYWELGKRLARGDEYSIYDPPRRIMRMPGFPLILAVSIRLGGESLFFARLFLAVLGAATCGLVYWLGTLLFDARVGVVAGLLAAVSPTLIGFSVELLSETAFGAGLVGSLILLTKLMQSGTLPLDGERRDEQRQCPRWLLAFCSGVGVAVATYMRPTWILAGPIYAVLHVSGIWVRTRSGQQVRFAVMESAMLLAGLATSLAPWTIRNWQITGHFVPTTLWVGPSLYDGQNPTATGDSNMQFFEEDRLLRSMSEYDMDREYRRRAWEFIRNEPLRSLQLGVIKLWRFWSPWPNAVQFRHWWICLGITAFFIPMIVFAALSVWRFRTNVLALLITVGPILYFSAVHAAFVGSVRYRLPAEYPLLVMTAAGVLWSWDHWHASAHSPQRSY